MYATRKVHLQVSGKLKDMDRIEIFQRETLVTSTRHASPKMTNKNGEREAKEKRKSKSNLLPEKRDIFRITQGLNKQDENYVSFQFRRSNWYLRAKKDECIIEPRRSTRHFEKECTFYPLVDLWFPGFVAFESTEKAAHYLRARNGHLMIEHYDASREFKEEASFLLKNKNSSS